MISPKRYVQRVQIERRGAETPNVERDVVAVEEPMEIRIGDHRVSVTMRTPGDDFELAAGFLFTEGLIGGREAIAELRYCDTEEPQEYNIVTARLRDPDAFDPTSLKRNFYTTSSCGVCGKASLEAIEIRGVDPLPLDAWRVDAATIRGLPEALRASQPVFERTGGIHAAGLFTPEGELLVLREDVGRHNAVDKVVGHRLLEDALPARDGVLAVSGRASFEIAQKALAAGIAMIVAVGAPSSLAVEVAERFGMTLVGFAKPTGFNVYTGAARIA